MRHWLQRLERLVQHVHHRPVVTRLLSLVDVDLCRCRLQPDRRRGQDDLLEATRPLRVLLAYQRLPG